MRPALLTLISSHLVDPLVLWMCVPEPYPAHPSLPNALPQADRGWGGSSADARLGLGISSTFIPLCFLVSFVHQGFLGCVVAAASCFRMAQCPGVGCPTAISATVYGDTQLSPATRLGVLVGEGQGGCPHGDELQGPRKQSFGGAGVGDRDLGSLQHLQSCPGMMLQQRGCGGVYPATLRAGGSRATVPRRAPHNSILGRWELGPEPGGWGRPGRRQGRGQPRPRGQSGGRKRVVKNKNPREENPNSAGSDISPVPRGEGATGRARGTAGCSQAGRMRPSGQGWDTVSTAELGTGGQEGQAVWDATA